jgi:hypothetical protein
MKVSIGKVFCLVAVLVGLVIAGAGRSFCSDGCLQTQLLL